MGGGGRYWGGWGRQILGRVGEGDRGEIGGGAGVDLEVKTTPSFSTQR